MRGGIRLFGHVRGHCILLERVQEGIVIKGLVIRVSTGIDDGNTRTCAGVAVGPDEIGTDHSGRSNHLRKRFFLLSSLRLISTLDKDTLHAFDGADGVKLA